MGAKSKGVRNSLGTFPLQAQTVKSQFSPLPIVSVWLGGELSYLEKLCLTSIVSVGHRTILYCYRDLRDVPNGIELRNAVEIMPEREFSCYRNGSYALGSDLFRYKLLSKFPCIWVDTDMYLIKPIDSFDEYIFGWEDDRCINTAILSLPSESKVLCDIHFLLSKEPFFAPWWTDDQVKIQEQAVQSGVALTLSELPWATSGPKLLTYLANKHRVSKHARSPETFYPVHWKDYRLPFLAGDQTEWRLTENTIGIHFWNHMLGDLKAAPSPDSFVARQCRKYGIEIISN